MTPIPFTPANVARYCMFGVNTFNLPAPVREALAKAVNGMTLDYPHTHPRRVDALGSTCPVCDPSTFWQTIQELDNADRADFAARYNVTYTN